MRSMNAVLAIGCQAWLPPKEIAEAPEGSLPSFMQSYEQACKLAREQPTIIAILSNRPDLSTNT